jgi:hypothetical protein
VRARARAAPRVRGPLDRPRENHDGRTDASAEAAEVTVTKVAAAEAAASEAFPPRKLPLPRGPPQMPPPMCLARERPWRPNCRKILAAAQTAWPRTPERSPGGPCLVLGPLSASLQRRRRNCCRASPRAAERLLRRPITSGWRAPPQSQAYAWTRAGLSGGGLERLVEPRAALSACGGSGDARHARAKLRQGLRGYL